MSARNHRVGVNGGGGCGDCSASLFLFHGEEEIVALDLHALIDVEGLDFTGSRSLHDHLHLHRRKHNKGRALLYRISDLHTNVDYCARHRGTDLVLVALCCFRMNVQFLKFVKNIVLFTFWSIFFKDRY